MKSAGNSGTVIDVDDEGATALMEERRHEAPFRVVGHQVTVAGLAAWTAAEETVDELRRIMERERVSGIVEAWERRN